MSPPVYSVHISFRRASRLLVGDILTLSSDPYVIATLTFPDSEPEAAKLHHRTPTIRRTLEPEWDDHWSIANVPASGIQLNLKVMDEDPAKHDDCLGVAHIETGPLSADFEREEAPNLKLRMGGDPWVLLTRLISSGCTKATWKAVAGHVDVFLKIERHPESYTPPLERPYTRGPNWHTQHFSPLIGMITNTAAPSGAQHFRFTASKLQLTGPLPKALKIQYVSFRPIIKVFYTKSGLRGRLLNRALKRQYRTIYSYDRATEYGISSPDSLAKTFLDLTGWELGGRLYTYIVTVDAEWRFTETGSEFGIQMLSKHTMHSCVSIHVGFAGEFFVRAKHPDRGKPRPGHVDDYELVIDNDSGTYRPPKEKIPDFSEFLEKNLKGMSVVVKDAFEDGHQEEKKAVVGEKEKVGGRRRFKQPSSRGSSEERRGSISSSDEEELRDGKIGLKRKIKKKIWEEMQKEGSFEMKRVEALAENGANGANGVAGPSREKGHDHAV